MTAQLYSTQLHWHNPLSSTTPKLTPLWHHRSASQALTHDMAQSSSTAAEVINTAHHQWSHKSTRMLIFGSTATSWQYAAGSCLCVTGKDGQHHGKWAEDKMHKEQRILWAEGIMLIKSCLWISLNVCVLVHPAESVEYVKAPRSNDWTWLTSAAVFYPSGSNVFLLLKRIHYKENTKPCD